MLHFAQAGGAEPIAARDTDAGCLAANVGRVGAHKLPARTAAFDGHCASTRAARQRRAQVCGEVTVGSDGQGKKKSGAWVGTSSTANAVPLPLIGEGLMPFRVGSESFHNAASEALPRGRRGEAHRRREGEGFTPPHQ